MRHERFLHTPSSTRPHQHDRWNSTKTRLRRDLPRLTNHNVTRSHFPRFQLTNSHPTSHAQGTRPRRHVKGNKRPSTYQQRTTCTRPQHAASLSQGVHQPSPQSVPIKEDLFQHNAQRGASFCHSNQKSRSRNTKCRVRCQNLPQFKSRRRRTTKKFHQDKRPTRPEICPRNSRPTTLM